MKIGWGMKITVLYIGFVLLIGTMVVASTHQHFDLVSNSYYADEIVYQKVIDAGKNQSALSEPIRIHANSEFVTLEFPAELKDKAVSGSIYFYSAVHEAWDRHMPIRILPGNIMSVARKGLQKTMYTLKINVESNGKQYYQESGLDLSK